MNMAFSHAREGIRSQRKITEQISPLAQIIYITLPSISSFTGTRSRSLEENVLYNIATVISIVTIAICLHQHPLLPFRKAMIAYVVFCCGLIRPSGRISRRCVVKSWKLLYMARVEGMEINKSHFQRDQ